MNAKSSRQNINMVDDSTLEFFRLDEIDRRVFIWLIDHVKLNSVKCWLEFIREDYDRHKRITLNSDRLFAEARELFDRFAHMGSRSE